MLRHNHGSISPSCVGLKSDNSTMFVNFVLKNFLKRKELCASVQHHLLLKLMGRF